MIIFLIIYFVLLFSFLYFNHKFWSYVHDLEKQIYQAKKEINTNEN